MEQSFITMTKIANIYALYHIKKILKLNNKQKFHHLLPRYLAL
jgi:hypothetical protein